MQTGTQKQSVCRLALGKLALSANWSLGHWHAEKVGTPAFGKLARSPNPALTNSEADFTTSDLMTCVSPSPPATTFTVDRASQIKDQSINPTAPQTTVGPLSEEPVQLADHTRQTEALLRTARHLSRLKRDQTTLHVMYETHSGTG